MEDHTTMVSFDYDLKMLNYFQEEFIYRHKHYWNTLIKLFMLIVVIDILPLATEAFGISLNAISNECFIFFPILALIISFFSLYVLYEEAAKIQDVNIVKYRINRLMVEKYHYRYHDAESIKAERTSKFLSNRITLFAFLLEVIISTISFILALYFL